LKKDIHSWEASNCVECNLIL